MVLVVLIVLRSGQRHRRVSVAHDVLSGRGGHGAIVHQRRGSQRALHAMVLHTEPAHTSLSSAKSRSLAVAWSSATLSPLLHCLWAPIAPEPGAPPMLSGRPVSEPLLVSIAGAFEADGWTLPAQPPPVFRCP